MTNSICEHINNPAYNRNIAVTAPGRQPLSYQALSRLLQVNTHIFRGLGLGRHSPVALVLPNGPEMAVAFLSAAAACTAAPLNPGYRLEEFEFYYVDLSIEAVLLPAGTDGAAAQAARKNGIKVIEIVMQEHAPAGVFTIAGADNPDPNSTPIPGPDPGDTALLLHTSGTTSRPKIVPLSHANLYTSAGNIAKSLQLKEIDRCLNIMPLFHIHGLVGCLLSSLSAGSSICCTGGFEAARFFEWMAAYQPSWYSAVPSMHQMILVRAPENSAVIQSAPLRFIRSSSAALSEKVKENLKTVFQTSVVEAYGMTEASHQIAVNLLPPYEQKPGSVGLPYGTEAAILSADGETLLPSCETGEIVIRGPGITSGYLRNPDANRDAFIEGGWFRTGDQGYMDADGAVFITGRLKEIINRGGEKVMPGEIDRVLLDHPAVDQAVTFAIPDDMLGEEIAAAVVRKDMALSEFELRLHAASRLADHKVPRTIIFLEQIPKGPTGKLQRIGLAGILGLTAKPDSPPPIWMEPGDDLKKLVSEIWQQILEIPAISINQDFLSIGGDSISAGRIANRISQEFEIPFSIVDFFEASSIEKQAQWVETRLLEQINALSEEEASQELDALLQDDDEQF